MDKPLRPLTVVRLHVDAFKRMRAARLHPSPTGLIPVRGRNAQGKSSLIESMMAALLGKEGAQELPIMEGAHGAHVVLDLGELVVKRTWKRDSGGRAETKLVVEDVRGVAQASPQKVLEGLLGHFADPVAFQAMKPDDQVKVVLGVLGLDAELAKLEAEATERFERRRDLGRESDRAKKHAGQLALEVEGVPVPAVSASAEELGDNSRKPTSATGGSRRRDRSASRPRRAGRRQPSASSG